MWEKDSYSKKERTTLLSGINLEAENTTAKKKCGNKAVGKRNLMTVEQFGPNPG